MTGMIRPLQDLAGRVAAMKAAAKADAADAEPEPVPQYDALLAEEVCWSMRTKRFRHRTIVSRGRLSPGRHVVLCALRSL